MPKDLRFVWRQGGHHCCVQKGEYRFFFLERVRAEVVRCVCVHRTCFRILCEPFHPRVISLQHHTEIQTPDQRPIWALEYTNGSGDVIELG